MVKLNFSHQKYINPICQNYWHLQCEKKERNFTIPYTFFLYWWEKEIHQKGASPKGLGWPLHREYWKKRVYFMGWVGVKVSVDVGLKQLKVISRGEDGGWEWVPISGGHRNKRVGESAGSIFIQFESVCSVKN